MATTATFVIDFGSVEDAFLTVELDSVKNGERTTFVAGDVVHFRVYGNTNYTIEVTAGTVANGATNVQEAITGELLSFVKGQIASTQKLIRSGSPIAYTWFGNDLGAISAVGANQLQALLNDANALGIASVDYSSEYNEHNITPPAGMSAVFHILVYIKAVA